MLPGYKSKTNTGVGVGVLLSLIGMICLVGRLTDFVPAIALIVLGQVSVFYGACSYAVGKGYSWLVGVAGLLFHIPGLLVISLLPDRHPEPGKMGSLGRLLTMVIIIGVVVGPVWYLSRQMTKDKGPVSYRSSAVRQSAGELDQLKLLGEKHSEFLKSGTGLLENRKLSVTILGGVEERGLSYLNDVKSHYESKTPRTPDDAEILRLINVELKRLEIKPQ